MNLFESAIEKGFNPDRKNYNIKNNWFGMSTYEPDLILSKGENKIIASLGGVFCSFMNGTTINSRLIRLIKNDVVIYETTTGVMPDEAVVKAFLSD